MLEHVNTTIKVSQNKTHTDTHVTTNMIVLTTTFLSREMCADVYLVYAQMFAEGHYVDMVWRYDLPKMCIRLSSVAQAPERHV